jgi:cytochrome c oxidase subunit 1
VVADHEAHHEIPTGIMRWLTTTNHKDIGTMYLTFSLIMFFVGGAMVLAIRAELFQPGLQLINPDFYNQLIGVHALIMIFAALMPAATGFAN